MITKQKSFFILRRNDAIVVAVVVLLGNSFQSQAAMAEKARHQVWNALSLERPAS